MALISKVQPDKWLVEKVIEVIKSTEPDKEYGVWKKAEAYDKILDIVNRYYLIKMVTKKPAEPGVLDE